MTKRENDMIRLRMLYLEAQVIGKEYLEVFTASCYKQELKDYKRYYPRLWKTRNEVAILK